MCKSNNQCVYKSFLCDGERDCADSSDEMGCSMFLIDSFDIIIIYLQVDERMINDEKNMF